VTDILVRHEGPIATVVFNRPKVRNAISLAMWTELARVIEGLVKDDSVRAVVFRGAGTEAFASGAATLPDAETAQSMLAVLQGRGTEDDARRSTTFVLTLSSTTMGGR